MAEAHIADLDWFPIAPGEYSNATTFDLAGGIPPLYLAEGDLAVKNLHCKKPYAIVQDSPPAQAAAATVEYEVKRDGGTMGQATVANQNPNLAPAVSQAASAGADCVAIIGSAATAGTAIPAIRQGLPKAQILTGTNDVTPTLVQQLGHQLTGVYLVDSMYPFQDNTPALTQFRKAMSKYEPNAAVDQIAEGGWASMLVAAAALKSIHGTVSTATFLKAMQKLNNLQTNILPPLTTTKTNTTPGYERVFSPVAFFEKVSANGKLCPIWSAGFP